jgi:hypothetical protein
VTINFEKPWFVILEGLYPRGLEGLLVSYREFWKLIPGTLLISFKVTLTVA